VFTGLIEEIGVVKKVEKAGDGTHITVGAALVLEGTRTGDSICIDGACQTVTSVGRADFTVFCSSVTVSLTTLGSFASGRAVNLERAMTPSSRMGGHIVQGHVDAAGTVRGVRKDASGSAVDIALAPELMRYVVPRGSIAVDGVSLTVVSAGKDGFGLYLIPETIGGTTLRDRRAGDRVNIETDVLAKYVERMLEFRAPSQPVPDDSLRKKLAEEGYL
jgi:riboflavin synthase